MAVTLEHGNEKITTSLALPKFIIVLLIIIFKSLLGRMAAKTGDFCPHKHMTTLTKMCI